MASMDAGFVKKTVHVPTHPAVWERARKRCNEEGTTLIAVIFAAIERYANRLDSSELDGRVALPTAHEQPDPEASIYRGMRPGQKVLGSCTECDCPSFAKDLATFGRCNRCTHTYGSHLHAVASLHR